MPINKITDLIKTELAELETSVAGRKSAIDKAYKEAIATAEQSKKEALKEFETETNDIEKLKITLKSLTGESSKSSKPKGNNPAKESKALEVPKSFEEAKTVNAKILFVISEIGEGFNEDIANGLAKHGKITVEEASNNLAGRLSTLKTKGLIIADDSQKKHKYSLS